LRRKILFVEGTDTSLDQTFYELLFPSVSVRSRETAREVRQAVKAMRSLEGLHHAKAYGLIDNDSLSEKRVNELRAEGIYALPTATIESLYYSQECMQAVADQQSSTLGDDADTLCRAARAAALTSLSPVDRQTHLASRVAELKLRETVSKAVPDRKKLAVSGDTQVDVSVTSPFPAELTKIATLHSADDLDTIIARYQLSTVRH
jgi:hypothetical protein